QNEVILAGKAVDASRASIQALEGSIDAARQSTKALQDLEAYLKVTAPFDGVITERLVHPGALAGPSMGPLLRLEMNSRLRLVASGAVVTTTERTFVMRANDGRAEWVDVRKGAGSADLVEVFGAQKENDRVVRRGSDEIREGTVVR